MNKLSNNEIKDYLLKMMVVFKDVCENNDLNYSLAGGTLLGAVRHNGFIPWDDDVDFCMPRKDFNKLKELYLTGEFPDYIKLLDTTVDSDFSYPFIRLIDTRTKIDKEYINDKLTTGLWIDIMPVDGLPEDKNKQKNVYLKAKIFQKVIMLSIAKGGNGTTLLKKLLKTFIVPICKILNENNFILKKLNKLSAKYPYDSVKYVGCIVWGLYGINEVMEKDAFEKKDFMIFEKNTFRVMGCWKDYLKNLYGDYMKLPPIKDRVNHSFDAWRK